MSEGKKFDSEKPKMYLLPPKATVEVAKVLTFGAAKYDEENWRKLDNLQNRYTGGALRHIFAHMDGEDIDPETGYSHLAHAMCCLLFKLEAQLEETSKEERVRELIALERSKSYWPPKPPGFFSEANHKEGSVRGLKYSVQYDPLDTDNPES
tara:strand:+ start:1125 stop:1580 length:456 start_codon:yes stop_codon:yes gene_type:complete